MSSGKDRDELKTRPGTFLAITPAEWDDEGENVIVPESARATGPVLKGSCKLSGRSSADIELDAATSAWNTKVAALRDELSALDGAMETALSQEETADLEDEDVESIQEAASQARGLMVGVTRPSIAQWKTCEALQTQIDSIKDAHGKFNAALQEVLAAYEEEEEEAEAEDTLGTGGSAANDIDIDVDSDMD